MQYICIKQRLMATGIYAKSQGTNNRRVTQAIAGGTMQYIFIN